MIDNYGNTPLHWAAEKNQVESVKFLLSKGANPNLQNSNMMAPLHLAVQGLYNQVAKVSLGGTHVRRLRSGHVGQCQLPRQIRLNDHPASSTSDQLLLLLKMMMIQSSLYPTVLLTKHSSMGFIRFSFVFLFKSSFKRTMKTDVIPIS